MASDGRTDGHGQNYIPPRSAGDKISEILGNDNKCVKTLETGIIRALNERMPSLRKNYL